VANPFEVINVGNRVGGARRRPERETMPPLQRADATAVVAVFMRDQDGIDVVDRSSYMHEPGAQRFERQPAVNQN
jgi:hypothetical protein